MRPYSSTGERAERQHRSRRLVEPDRVGLAAAERFEAFGDDLQRQLSFTRPKIATPCASLPSAGQRTAWVDFLPLRRGDRFVGDAVARLRRCSTVGGRRRRVRVAAAEHQQQHDHDDDRRGDRGGADPGAVGGREGDAALGLARRRHLPGAGGAARLGGSPRLAARRVGGSGAPRSGGSRAGSRRLGSGGSGGASLPSFSSSLAPL